VRMKSKCYGERRFIAHALMIPALALTTLLLSVLPLHAQETVDPRSGRLLLTATDLVLPAGSITLEITRTLEPQRTDRGLLGTRWRLNWESRVVPRGPLMLIEETPRPVAFTASGTTPGYTSVTGDRLVVERDGRAVRSKLDGIRETFDVQGRLIERDYRNGNKITLRYGPDGRLARLEAPKGAVLQFGFDAAGRLIRVESSTSATVRYAYTNDALTEVQVKGRPPIRYGYDATGALVRIENPRSGAVEIAYDTRGRVLSRRWADGGQERYAYDDAANRLRHTDPAGGTTTIQWSQDRRQAEITDPLGHKSVIVSDAAGRPLGITGPTGATARISYDPLGRTVAVQNPLGQATRFDYVGDASRLKMITRPDGTQEVFEYDTQRNLAAMKRGTTTLAAFTYHPDGSVATAKGWGTPEQKLTYHPDGRLASIMDALGAKIHLEYDRRGNLMRETNPLGGVVRYQYDAQDRLVSVTDPVGGITRYEYDPQGRPSRVTNPSGAVTRYEYDLGGRLVALTDPGGQTTRYTYAVSGRLAAVIAPDGTTESFQYDALGNQTGWTDRLGRSTAFTNDPLGRISREHWPTSLEIRYRYDALGNLVGAEDTTGAKGEFQRDPFGQLTAHVDPLGAVTRYQFDPLGNLLARTDPRGQSTRFAYTPEGRLATAQEPSGDAARYEYDQAGRLVAAQRPSGGVTRFSYDAMGSVTAEVDPLGNQWRHTYDAAGRLVSTTNAAGRVTRYAYDRSGRLTEKRLPDGKRVTYQYDRLGNLVSADDGAFPVRRSYDPAGRLVRVEYPAIKTTLGYEYDGSGLRTKLTGPEGRATRYEYTAQKRLAAIVLPDGKRIGVTYDEKSRLQLIRYPNGITGRWEYDAAGQVTRITYQDPTGKSVAGWIYRYDPAGNPVEQQDSGGRTTSFKYDPAGQLTEEAVPNGTTRYRYLPGGNRAAVEEGGTLVPYRHDASDRVLQAGQEQLTYDANGNLVARKGSAGTTAYEYDTGGRLVKVVGPDGTTTSFGYTPTGERVWRRERNGLTYFVYDGLDLIAELSETGATRVTYVHGPGIDEPLAMLRDGRTYFYHADRLGSIRLLTDEQGKVAAAYDYDAFGKPTTSQTSTLNPFTFTGREWDAITGLYYYRARYYDPSLGRFLSPDPLPAALDQPLDQNPYLYVRNQPLRLVDPLGLTDNPVVPPPFLDPGRGVPLRPRPPVFGGGWETLPESPTNVANKLARIESGIEQWRGRGPDPGIKDWRPGGGMGEGAVKPDPRLTNMRDPYWQKGWDLLAERQRLRGLLPPGEEGAGLLSQARAGWQAGGPPPPRPLPSEGPARHLRGGLSSFQQPGPGMSAATLEATLTRWVVRGGTWVLIVVATGKILTSDDPGGAALDAAEGMDCAAVGTVVGSCLLGPPGGFIGGFIGALLGPPVLDTLLQGLTNDDGTMKNPWEVLLPGLPPPTPENIATVLGLGGQGGVPEAGGQPGEKGGWNVGPQGPTYLAPGGAPPVKPGQEVQIPMCRDERGNLVPCGGALAGKPGQEVQIPLCKDERGDWVPCHSLGRGSDPGRVPSSGPGSTQPGPGGSTSGSPPGPMAKAPAGPAAPSGAPAASLAGNWCSNLGNTAFQQSGASVTGNVTNQPDGKTSQIGGTFDGATLTFKWSSTGGGSGTGELRPQADGSLSGPFKDLQGKPLGTWTLRRQAGPCPSTAPATAQQKPAAPPGQMYNCYDTCYKLCTGMGNKDCEGMCPYPKNLFGTDMNECYWKSPAGLQYKKEHGMK